MRKRTTKRKSDAMRVESGKKEFLEAASECPHMQLAWWCATAKEHGKPEHGMQRGSVPTVWTTSVGQRPCEVMNNDWRRDRDTYSGEGLEATGENLMMSSLFRGGVK